MGRIFNLELGGLFHLVLQQLSENWLAVFGLWVRERLALSTDCGLWRTLKLDQMVSQNLIKIFLWALSFRILGQLFQKFIDVVEVLWKFLNCGFIEISEVSIFALLKLNFSQLFFEKLLLTLQFIILANQNIDRPVQRMRCLHEPFFVLLRLLQLRVAKHHVWEKQLDFCKVWVVF